ncbi:MAG: SMP-30/gluconolactonase/LRE family protein [Chloroflexi bacterium]|nr:SMP-30/gluconolactonase/LRE family protein [Chloroflexota bacterium]
MDIKLIANYDCICGEGPLWHPLEHKLYWADINTARIFRYDPAAGRHEQVSQDEPLGGFTIQADGKLLLFGRNGAVRTWHDGIIETVVEGIEAEQGCTFNDVIADPRGRVFCGTMPGKGHLGSLYRLDLDGSITHLFGGIGCSNGMGFTADLKRMYYTDSTPGKIYVFDYDIETGSITNQRDLVSVDTKKDGLPDGMTVDADGNLWSARWDGSSVYKFAPDGTQLDRIILPALKVSSVTFGGDDLMDMYVTSAIGAEGKAGQGEGAGGLFRLRPGVRGVPEFYSRIKL